MTADKRRPPAIEISVVSQPHWMAVFLLIALAVSVVVVPVGLVLSFSVQSDVVFALYAFVGGAVADFVIRSRFRRSLVLITRPRIPLMVGWCVLCIYVALLRPFE